MLPSDTGMEKAGNEVKKRMHLGNVVAKMRRLPGLVWKKIWTVGQEDPRRVIHSLKVGFALTIVSLLYLLEPLFKGIGQNAMWAVITVVVVFEFTAGATLCKGLNRGFGTLCAGSLAFFIEYIANETGQIFRAIFISFSVFLIGASATYVRFFPYIKKKYEYGVVIFLLTFNLITVSSYRVHNIIHIAHERIYTIAIGCGLCLLMSLLVFPNWSGEDLHKSIVSKFEGLARSIEACVNEYFQDEKIKTKSPDNHIFKGYKAVLDSKSSEETLAQHASWEPRRSIHCYRDPWQQYVKVGAALRHFGYTAVALHGCLQSEIQTPQSVLALFKDPCIRVATEVSKVLMELADSIRNHHCCSPEVLADQLQEALHDLNNAIKSHPRLFIASKHKRFSQKSFKDYGIPLSSVKTGSSALPDWRTKQVTDHSEESESKSLGRTLSKIDITSLEFSEALPFAAFASLLVEIVARLDLVIEEVEELGRKASFRELKPGEEQITVTREKLQAGKAVELQTHLSAEGTV